MYKLEFKLTLPFIFTSIPFVMLLFLLTLGMFEFYQDLSQVYGTSNTVGKNEEQVFKVDLQASVALNENNIEGLGVNNAELYVIKVEKKKSGISSLFDRIKKQTNKDVFKIKKSNQSIANSKSLPNYNAFLSSSEKLQMNEKIIRDLVSSKKHLFRGCYNRLLIKDGLLAGIATITISSGGKGKSQFKGIGRTKVIKELKSCLNTQVSKIDFSNIDMNKAIRFSLNFSS